MFPLHSTRAIGETAENIVCNYLVKRGLQIVKRNCFTRFGEIDILARDRTEFVCVEVRSRRKKSALSPSVSFSAKKYRNLVLTILSLPFLTNRPVRIDLVVVFGKSVCAHYRDIRPENVSPSQKVPYALEQSFA